VVRLWPQDPSRSFPGPVGPIRIQFRAQMTSRIQGWITYVNCCHPLSFLEQKNFDTKETFFTKINDTTHFIPWTKKRLRWVLDPRWQELSPYYVVLGSLVLGTNGSPSPQGCLGKFKFLWTKKLLYFKESLPWNLGVLALASNKCVRNFHITKIAKCRHHFQGSQLHWLRL
jgi:hypothetical protein